jgi:CRISPR system Cascade subunit CasC
MFVELHVIQNFAPANLNRDDTNAPKDCTFGGHRRARISSQCLKRAIRTYVREHELLPAEHLAQRTKRMVAALTGRLVDAGRPEAEAQAVVQAAMQGLSAKVDDKDKTQYLWFLGRGELDALANVCLEHRAVLLSLPQGTPQVAETAAEPATAKAAKKAARASVPEPVRKALEGCLDGGKAADLALFGRMIADLPEKNIDAASQVAHAISTHKVALEFDFYTAVDDLKPEDTAGADMMGTVEFNSACFYRYSNIDLEQLRRNLGNDEDLVLDTVRAFLKAAIKAVPTGKQNSMAAQNQPSFVFAVVRGDSLWSLANAFVRPVSPEGTGDLVSNSIASLADYWSRLVRMYGGDGISLAVAASTEDGHWNLERVTPLASVPALVESVVRHLGAER